jgi:hypothetical protein
VFVLDLEFDNEIIQVLMPLQALPLSSVSL